MKLFRILTVCTGNICRSPLAEALLRKELDSEAFDVTSSGIRATPGTTVPQPQVQLGAQLGLTDLTEHRAELTTRKMLAESDLILSMSRGHRKRVLQLEPSIARRSFTIREFARLASSVSANDVERQLGASDSPLAAAIDAVASVRGMIPPLRNIEDLDVIDPYKKPSRIFRQSRDELVPAAATTAAFLNSIVDLFGMEGIPVVAPAYEGEITIPDVHFPSTVSLRSRRVDDAMAQAEWDTHREVS